MSKKLFPFRDSDDFDYFSAATSLIRYAEAGVDFSLVPVTDSEDTVRVCWECVVPTSSMAKMDEQYREFRKHWPKSKWLESTES